MPKDSKKTSLFSYSASDPVRDAVNLRILEELEQNPRLTMSELGRRVNMSSPSVTERVKRLEESGVIQGYRLDINPVALGLPVSAYVRIRPNPGQLPKVAEAVKNIREVIVCDRVTGEDCFVIKVYLPSIEQLDRLLDELLLYGTTTTSIVQSSPVPLRTPPLPG